MQTTTAASSTATQAQQPAPRALPEIKTSYLTEVYFPNTGKRHTFRWPTLRRANRCAKDFPSGQTSVRAVRGYMTFEGWVQVQGGAA